MPTNAVSRTANVDRNGGHKWVKLKAVRLRTRPNAAGDTFCVAMANYEQFGREAKEEKKSVDREHSMQG